ncbi:hypothetical protein SLEP1_g6121 [Rubroshorea leprosula]|uniref:Reverse transcriptase domain-containing protein n=1 Tax=Rubroshorea leprosula TaxID=152421 RepID=A0AAV5I397_9ROSI|nr:hypothetical protein SLEP1_g6121 [Rubroshorea leprosula]
MWFTFRKYGRVLAIYCPQRKSKSGSRFGFVRFLDVKNEVELERKLDQITVGMSKLWVNRPRFRKEEVRNRAVTKPVEINLVKPWRSFAEVVKGNQGLEASNVSHSQPVPGATAYKQQQQNTVSSKSTTQVWMKKNNDRASAGLEFTVKEEDLQWLEGCYVGIAHSVTIIPTLQEKFLMEGYFSCKVRPLGGRLVLLEGSDKDEIKELAETTPEWLGQWFEEVKPWTPSMVARERFVWIRCHGVPVHVWGPEFFSTIGAVWGKVISLDDSTSRKLRFDIGRMLISTHIMEFISKSMSISVNGVPYVIKVMEEEATNGIFSMKSDHVFRELSSSDDQNSEAWSLNSDGEEAFDESVHDGGCFKDCWNDEVGRADDEVKARADDVTENQEVEVTVRKKKFEFEEDKDSRLSADGSNIQINNEYNDASSGNSQKLLISVQGETAEGGSYVPHSLSMQLMQSQRQYSNCENGIINGPAISNQQLQQVGGKVGGLDSQPCLRIEGSWASSMGLNKTNSLHEGQDEVEVRDKELDKADVDEMHRRSKGSLCRRSRESPCRLEDFSEVQSFWQGFESESGQLKAWMGREERITKKKKKKRTRSCSFVYKKSRNGSLPAMKEKQCRSRKYRDLEERSPNFSPGSQNQVADESITDSGIQNRNRCLQSKGNAGKVVQIWEFAKEIGVVDHGAGSNGKRKAVRDLVIREKVEFLSIQESKLEVVDFQICRALWGAENFEWVAQPSKGMAGGLICIWNADLLEKNRTIEGENFIGVLGFWGASRTPVYIINIYSPCDLSSKRVLWVSLKNLIIETGGNWCLMGDFNAVRSEQEWRGGMSSRREMPEFDDFINECGLVDLPLIGRKFTWYQSNGASMSRLDRFLLSEEWCLNWENVKQWGLNRSFSDHCPIILKNQIMDWGPKPFRFFDAWLEFPQFKGMVRDIWMSTVVNGWNGFCLKEKLKEIKKVLKVWSKNMVSEIDLGIQNCIDSIAVIDKKGEVTSLAPEDIELRRTNFLDLWKNQRIKESIWRQKARKTWISEGDANTKFFHRCVKGRRRLNDITSIRVGSERPEEVNNMKESVANYFETLFKEDTWQRPTLDGIEFKRISDEERVMLEAPFTVEEVRQAVWNCESSKAPGPDGFNFKFVKEMWDTIKNDIMGFVTEFHKNGKLVRGLNSSFIVLIPKVASPQKIEEFRPISLVGVMYKLIAKLLACRLSSVLNGIIGETQMAFVGERQLVDSVVIANETIEEAQRRKKKGFVFKADFEKAYDKVCWGFLEYMLLRLGFGNKWRVWISECLKTAEVSVLLNGSATRQFKMQRGLRQGDPLSPFLFLIVAEGLIGIISSAVSLGLFNGIAIGQRGMNVTHLQFADDSIVFGEASDENIWAVKSVMRIFEMVSGLKVNFGKSVLMGINVSEEWMSRTSSILNCKQGKLPCKYLGVPIGGKCRSIATWRPMIESFKKKLASWKNKFISLGGRITLLNSVLSSLPVFTMSVHLLPKGLILILDKIRRSFLWGGGESIRKVNWVCWEKVCRSKLEGGLGVKDLRKFNLALLGKWWSRIAEGEEGLLYRVIREKYGSKGGNWLNWIEEGKQRGSLWWRDVCRLDYLNTSRVGWLSDGFTLELGEGNSVRFWEDVWLGDTPLSNKFPRLFLNSLDKTKCISQLGHWNNGSWNWSLKWRRPIFSWEEISMSELWRLLQTIQPIKGQKDRWKWRHDKGAYSAKSGYQALSSNQHERRDSLYKRVWCRLVPTKVCAFVWKAIQDRIPSKMNLYRRGIVQNLNLATCTLCNGGIEDTNHLLLHCNFAYSVWSKCLQWWRISSVRAENCYASFEQQPASFKNANNRAGWDAVCCAIIWSLWIARNERAFRNQEQDINRIFELVQLRSFQWIKNRSLGYSFDLCNWMFEPMECLKDKRRRNYH